MARRQTAARRYAEAAFEIARQDGTIDRWESDLRTMRDSFNAQLERVAEDPGIEQGDKERVMGEAFRDVSPEALNLVMLLVQRRLVRGIGSLVERFEELARRERGVTLAEVRTALQLDDAQRDAVMSRLRELTGNRVEIREIVDESLIGGIAVRIGDVLYDSSVRGRLERLRERLAGVAA